MSYKPGDNLCVCDICGFRRLSSEMRMNYNKMFVCKECFEPKHEQYVSPKPRHEKQTVSIHRPEKEPVFLSPGDVTADDL